MIRTSTGSPYSGIATIKKSIKRNRILAILLCSFFIAMLYGSVLIAQADTNLKEKLLFLTREYLLNREGQSILATFFSSLSTSFIYLISAFLLGFFALGQPICIFIVLFRGFGLGVSMGQIYLNYQAQGFLYCLVLIIPATVFSTLILFAALKDSIQSANLFLAVLFPKFGAAVTTTTIKIYGTRYLIYFVLTVLTAALDAGINFLFSGIISL